MNRFFRYIFAYGELNSGLILTIFCRNIFCMKNTHWNKNHNDLKVSNVKKV